MKVRNKFQLSPKALKELDDTILQIDNKKIIRKLETIKMKHLWLSHQVIADIFWITLQTISDWLKLYKDKGIEGLVSWNYNWKDALLSSEQIEIIEKRIREKPFETAKECVHFIQENFWIKYHLHSMQKILKKNFNYHSRNKK
jgi:transposase